MLIGFRRAYVTSMGLQRVPYDLATKQKQPYRVMMSFKWGCTYLKHWAQHVAYIKLSTLAAIVFESIINYLTKASSAAAAKSLQSCLTLCDPKDVSPPGSPIPGILQARTLEWVAIFFSSAWKWKVKVKSLSRVRLLATPWTAAYQAPPSMGFSRQEYWSGVPLPSSKASSD